MFLKINIFVEIWGFIDKPGNVKDLLKTIKK